MNPHPFDQFVLENGDRLRVAHAALLFALDEYPALKPLEYLERLAALAKRVDQRATGSPASRLNAMRRVLVDEEEFRGNAEDYHDPLNSYLNEVMDRKLGLPITLAAVWIDISEQLGWRFEGVNFPGHYLVRGPDEVGGVLIAPFEAGREVGRDEMVEMLAHAGVAAPLSEAHFATATPRMTLTRMLNNLRAVYTDRGAWGKAMRVVERMLAMDPSAEALRREYEELAVRQAEMN